jgi:hypothetical protein
LDVEFLVSIGIPTLIGIRIHFEEVLPLHDEPSLLPHQMQLGLMGPQEVCVPRTLEAPYHTRPPELIGVLLAASEVPCRFILNITRCRINGTKWRL